MTGCVLCRCRPDLHHKVSALRPRRVSTTKGQKKNNGFPVLEEVGKPKEEAQVVGRMSAGLRRSQRRDEESLVPPAAGAAVLMTNLGAETGIWRNINVNDHHPNRSSPITISLSSLLLIFDQYTLLVYVYDSCT